MHREETPRVVPSQRPIFRLPVNTDFLFLDKKGDYSPRIEKKRTKLLQKLGFLAGFLEEGETVVFVTTGCSPFSTVEQLTIGHLWIMAIKRALFVFTNRRILHIPTTGQYEYRGSIAQILYQDCRRLYVKGSALRAEYLTGKTESFLGIPGPDRATIQRLNIAAPEPAEPSDRPERNHLCPSCAQVLAPETTACPACGHAFKTAAAALKYSLLLPGGGYFYARRWVLGVLDAIGETYLLLITLVALVGAALGNPQAAPVLVMFGLLLAIEKAITIYHAKKFIAEFIPRDPNAVQPPRRAPSDPYAASSTPERTQTLEQLLSVR